MTNDAIRDLIERVERAEGPDRPLDAEILAAKGTHVLEKRGRDRKAWWYEIGGPDYRRLDPDGGGYFGLPRFTASIDAAMSLVPTGWIVEIRRYFNSDGEYVTAVDLTDSGTVGRGCHPEEELTVQSRIVEQRQGHDPTPSAIVSASLRARLSTGA